MSVAYNRNFADEETADCHKLRFVFEQAQQDGWGRDEFAKRVDAFLKTNKYPTWTPAEFFAADRPALYDYAWALERWGESRENKHRIACYTVDTGDTEPIRLFGWRHECDGKLPEHKATFPPHMTGNNGERMTPETWESVQRLKASMGGSVAEVEKAERRLPDTDAAMADANLLTELAALRGFSMEAATAMVAIRAALPPALTASGPMRKALADLASLVSRAERLGLLPVEPLVKGVK